MNEIFVDVLLPLPLPNLYTYKVDKSDHNKNITKGARVCVQFGRKKLYSALIVNIHNTPPKNYETKTILCLLDEKPVVNEIQLTFWDWISGYYMCTRGEVYKAAVPSGLKLESETSIIYGEKEVTDKLTPLENRVLDLLEKEKTMTIKDISSATGRENMVPCIKSLYEKDYVALEERLKSGFRAKTEKVAFLNEKYSEDSVLHELFDSLERAPKQLKIVMSYLAMVQYPGKQQAPVVKTSDLLKKAGASSSALKALADKEIFYIREKETGRLTVADNTLQAHSVLNTSQKKACKNIVNHFKTRHVVLLHGVTSSGKTEIYIKLIREQLDKGKQVLYLLPEIALTAQIVRRLQSVFGNLVGVYHSKYNDAERVEIWYNLMGKHVAGQARYSIILGVRSSVFLPFDNLGMIIVDEEHENTYKQFDPAPRYHARDAAIMLASLHKAKVLLGTATPSLESYFNAKNDKYGLVELNERFLDLKLPAIQIINIKEARRKKQMKSIFSPQLIDNIENALSNGEQVILFQNRRGFAPYLECRQCGMVPRCRHCDVSLTYHKQHHQLVCHYCGYTLRGPFTCEACGSTDFRMMGFGTEKIEDETSLFFPEAKIARMDLDSTRSRKSYERIISDFENGNTDILIGTQMISKGLDFNNVKVVGILNADNMLNFPDFRSHERAYQLMAQVSGRAGRKKEKGTVIIQTSDPNHYIIKNVLDNDYTAMFNNQLEERKTFSYPPVFRLIRINVKHRQYETVEQGADLLAQKLRSVLGNRVVGPEYPLINRIQNKYIKTLLLKLEKTKSISWAKQQTIEKIAGITSQPEFKSLIIIPDVDPM